MAGGCGPRKRPVRLPEVLTPDEVAAVLHLMAGINGLVARLLYGTECGSWGRSGCAYGTLIWLSSNPCFYETLV